MNVLNANTIVYLVKGGNLNVYMRRYLSYFSSRGQRREILRRTDFRFAYSRDRLLNEAWFL